MATIDYSSLIKNMPVAYALHEMIYDAEGKAVDYRFIDVNNEFEILTGLKSSVVLGKTCLEIMPETEYYWIDKFEECIKTGNSVQYDNFSREINRYFQVTAYSPAPGQFIALFLDVSDRVSEFNKSDKVASFFKSITENATDAIVILDRDIKYSYVSPSAFKLTGYELHDIDDIDPAELTHPDDLVYLLPELQRLLAEPAYKPTLSYRFKIKSGEWLWIESTFSNLYDHPEVQGIVINFRDISEQKEYLEKLKLNEQRYRLTQEVGNIGSWEYSIVTQKYWNSHQLRRLFGIEDSVIDTAEINEKIISTIIDYERVDSALKNLIEHHKLYELEFEIVRPDNGQKRLLYSRAELVPDSENNYTFVRGVVIDITEQKANEQRLKQSEALLAATLRHSRFSIWSVDTDNKLLYANDTFVDDFQKTFGVKLELGKSVVEILPDDLKQLWLDRYRRTFENNSFVEEDEITIGDEKIYIEVSATPIYVDDKVVGASFYGENITARKQAELRIIESEKTATESAQQFDKIFRKNPTLLALTDVNYQTYADVNEEFLRALEFEREEVIGKSPVDLGIICDIDAFYEAGKIMKENRVLENFEMKVKSKSGKILTGLFSGQFVENHGREFSLTVMVDITEKKVFEQQLLSNTRNLSKTLKATTEFILPKSGKIDYDYVTKLLIEISGAKYIVFNWYEKDISYTKSVTGFEKLNQIMDKYLGVNVFDKKWQRQSTLDTMLNENNFTVLKDISKLLSFDFNEATVKLLLKFTGLGEVALVALNGKNRIVGNLIFIYEKKVNMENKEMIELFSYQLGQYIERTNAEKELQAKLEEMERFHKLTVNRELNMIELKKEVNQLLLEQGRNIKYRIVT